MLIALAAVPLILFRGSPILESRWFVPGTCFAAIVLCIVWFRTCRSGVSFALARPGLVWQDYFSLGVLLTITVVSFYVPQRLHFWGGYDDCQAYQDKVACLWGSAFDRLNGRPALGWSYYFGWLVGGGKIEGIVWFAGILCFTNSVLLWAILRLYMPQSRAICLAAAVLLIINRSDPLKFYPLWAASPYALAVGCLLSAILLFLTSWRRQNRLFLILSCFLLATSLLMYEVGYLLAMIPFILLWLERKQSPFWKFWAFGWWATLSLFALRVALFQLTSESSYQLSQASAAKISLQSLASNFALHIMPIAHYFEFKPIDWGHMGVASFVFSVVLIAMLTIGWADCKPSIRIWSSALLFATLGILLGVFPYSHLVGIDRTQFFAAPSQSLFIAIGLAAIGFFLSRRLALAFLSGAIALMSANSTVLSYVDQQRHHHVTYDKIVHVCQEIRAISSSLPSDVLIVLLHDGAAPLGTNYGTYAGSDSWVGAKMVQMGESPDPFMQCSFTPSKVQLTYYKAPLKDFDYDRLILFRLDSDGTLYLEPEWPVNDRLPSSGAGYNPLKLLSAGAISNRRNFDFPAWSGPPADIASFRNGIVLGRGWSSREFESGWLFRDANQGAELIVNGQGNTTFELNLDLQLINSGDTTGSVDVINSKGEVVAKTDIGQRKQFHMSLPCSKEHLEVYRLHINSDAHASNSRNASIRVFSPLGPLKNNPLPYVPTIASGGARLGKGWYPIEVHEGRSLRWLNTDGEVYSGRCDSGKVPALVLEASVGPGMDGKPASLELLSSDGSVLGATTVTGRDTVVFPLPKDFPSGTRMLLKVTGGGREIPSDPRILNLLVTKCEWQSTAIPLPDITDEVIQLRSGWYAVEKVENELFRWLNTDAELRSGVSIKSHSPAIVLDLAPGPSLRSPVCVVDILDSSGNVLATHAFDKRERIAMRLSNFPGDNALLRLQVRDGGKSIPGEARLLNAQVFRCEWLADSDSH